MTTVPPRIAQTVCRVRSTQNVVPAPALQLVVSVVARRWATSRVVGPARPSTGRMPYLFWNFLMAAQSAADCRPSTVTAPNPPRRARYVSTARWCWPCGQPLAVGDVGVEAVGFGLGFFGGGVVERGAGDAGVGRPCWAGPDVPLAPDACSAAPTGAAPPPPLPPDRGSNVHAPVPTSTTTTRANSRELCRTRRMAPPLDSRPFPRRS
jgi:hypothetical protein